MLDILIAFLIVVTISLPIAHYIDKWYKEMQQEDEDDDRTTHQ